MLLSFLFLINASIKKSMSFVAVFEEIAFFAHYGLSSLSRINFKIAMLTFKCLRGFLPQ